MDSNIVCILIISLSYICMISIISILAKFAGQSASPDCSFIQSIYQVNTTLLLTSCLIYHTLWVQGILPLLYLIVYSPQMTLLQQLRKQLGWLLLPGSVPFISVSQQLKSGQQRVAPYGPYNALSARLHILMQKTMQLLRIIAISMHISTTFGWLSYRFRAILQLTQVFNCFRAVFL